jgi:hypothetical protein
MKINEVTNNFHEVYYLSDDSTKGKVAKDTVDVGVNVNIIDITLIKKQKLVES